MNSVGFTIEPINNNGYEFNPMALVSLKKAVNAYYSTYKGIQHHAIIRDDNNDNKKYYTNEYKKYYLDIIIYFHHFFEITIKDLLENGNILLSRNIDNAEMCDILFGELNGNSVNPDDYKDKKTIEFSDALRRLKVLVSKIYTDGSFDFLVQTLNYDTLTQLNQYRNRLLHRGKLVFTFTELDSFIGGHIFPIIKEIFNHPYYSNYKKIWCHIELDCKHDILEEIINECSVKTPNYPKIAVLKEMGRAAYMIPKFTKMNQEEMVLAKASVVSNVNKKYVKNMLKKCPVCGKVALYSYNEREKDVEYTLSVECLNCTFELDCGYIMDMSQFGLNIDNYFA